jgi:hypothetical protein
MLTPLTSPRMLCLQRARRSGFWMMAKEQSRPAMLKVLLGAISVMAFLAMSVLSDASGV